MGRAVFPAARFAAGQLHFGDARNTIGVTAAELEDGRKR
jgi:hypothetical protein